MEFLIALVILIADIWAIVSTLKSPTTSHGWKAFWVLLILFLPILGLVIWLIAGPRAPKTSAV